MKARRESPWAGIYAAMLTPLREDESLDEELAADLAGRLLDAGLAGLYLAGSTGEWHGLDDAERVRLFRVVAEAAGGRGRLIAHVGGVVTRRAAGLAAGAGEAKMHAVAALPPMGTLYDIEELRDYYQAISNAGPCPVFIYHMPRLTGYSLGLDELSRLMELEGVTGIKFTCEDFFLLERLAGRFPEKAVMNGLDGMLLSGLAAGAVGAIGSTYNLVAPAALAVLERFRSGDLAGARAAQAALNEFVGALPKAPWRLRAFKALAAEVYGWPSARNAAPGRVPPAEALEPMRRALESVLAAFPRRRRAEGAAR